MIESGVFKGGSLMMRLIHNPFSDIFVHGKRGKGVAINGWAALKLLCQEEEY